MHVFSYRKLRLAVFDEVYEPAEDSFLLAKFAANLKGSVLEIGCGTGIASLANAINNPENTVIGTDIDPIAVENSVYNSKMNGIENAKFFKSNIFSAVRGKFDCILFNPPYLPTTKSEKLSSQLNLAYDGGKSGRRILNQFLTTFERHLKPKGQVFLIHSSLNDLGKTKKFLAKRHYECVVAGQESFFFETICLLRVYRR